MQIDFQNPSLNFKQIKLSEMELISVKNKYGDMLRELNNPKHNYRMFDIFESHLNNEVELKNYKTGKERKYFATNLYIKFFEILDTVKTKNLPIESFIDHLNNYIDKFYIRHTPDTDIQKLQDYNVTSAKNAAHYMYKYLDMSKEEFLKLAQTVPFFPRTFCNYLKNNTNILVENLGFTEKECIDLYKRNPALMVRSGNNLVEKAKSIIGKLNIENNEDFRAIVKSNPSLYTFDYLDDSIQNIAKFLDTEEDNVKKMIKSQPYLATTKINHIKRNFFAMKDYLKVERDKMVEIAIMAPVTIALPFDMCKKKYEDIANILGILPETYFNKANSLPAMYRISIQKLEKYIDFIMTKLSYTREEAINYIAKNLNVLSYKYTNMVSRSDANYEILNKELNINYETFLDLLEKNAWIMGHKEEFIDKHIKDVRAYFDIDKKTEVRMFEDNPQLITYFVENIDRDITDASEYFKIDKEEYKQMCITEPLLATRPLKHHLVDIRENAKIMGMTEKEFIEFGRKNPEFLAYDSEQIAELKEKMNLKNK